MHTFSFADCASAVIIKAENDAKHLAGTYHELSYLNGKPTYSKGYNNIWYNLTTNQWMIGGHEVNRQLKNDSTVEEGIDSKDDMGGVTDDKNIWHYHTGDDWKTAKTNDIIAEYHCSSGTS